jgi:hypothetical protein
MRVLALLAAVALMTACGGSSRGSDTVTTAEVEPPSNPAEFAETRLYAATSALVAGGFTMRVDSLSMTGVMYRHGDNVVTLNDDLAGVYQVDGRVYTYCDLLDVWWFMDDDGTSQDLFTFSPERLEWVGAGEEEFGGRSLPFEDYIEDDTVIRYYFDEHELVGLKIIGFFDVIEFVTIPDAEEVTVVLTAGVPDGAFDAPDGALTYDEYLVLVAEGLE